MWPGKVTDPTINPLFKLPSEPPRLERNDAPKATPMEVNEDATKSIGVTADRTPLEDRSSGGVGEGSVFGTLVQQKGGKKRARTKSTDNGTASTRAEKAPKDSPSHLKVKVRTERGSATCMLDLSRSAEDNKRVLDEFLAANNFVPQGDAWAALMGALPSSKGVAKLTIDKLVPRQTATFPQIGLSHELEMRQLQASRSDSDNLQPAQVLAESDQRFNGHPAVQLVAETMGKAKPTAMVEMVSGPYSTPEQLHQLLGTVDGIVRESTPGARSMETVTSDSNKDGERLTLQPKLSSARVRKVATSKNFPNVQSTVDIPIRNTSSVLSSEHSGIKDAPRRLVGHATGATNAFLDDVGLKSSQGHKLWETMNLFMWMACAEAVVHKANGYASANSMPDNRALEAWLQNNGKGFYGVLPRFSPGDLLRTGGLKEEDRTALEKALGYGKKANREALAGRTFEVFTAFVGDLKRSRAADLRQLGAALEKDSASVKERLLEAVDSQFKPGGNKDRYTDDTSRKYGQTVKRYEKDDSGKEVSTPSLSLAGGQYLPGRKTVTDVDAPVSAAYEMRTTDYPTNQKVQNYFTGGVPEKRRAELEKEIWADFQGHVDGVAKK